MEYCNNFEYDLKLGQIKERELADIFENKTIEVKTDLIAKKTGRVFVEYESREKPSGISTSKSDYYCFIISKNSYIIITTTELKNRCRKHLNTSLDKRGGDNNTSKGILLHLIDLL
jgi:hypothetical protein